MADDRYTCNWVSKSGSTKLALTYLNGELEVVHIQRERMRPDTAMMWNALYELIPRCEAEFQLQKLEGVGFVPVQEQAPANEKIALWCRIYKELVNTTYKVSGKEAKLVSGAEFSEELVRTFFACTEWWAKPKTLERYCNQNNALLDHVARAKAGPASTFPDRYDAKFERTLNDEQRDLYRAHLRALGWECELVTTPGGGTTARWKAPNK